MAFAVNKTKKQTRGESDCESCNPVDKNEERISSSIADDYSTRREIDENGDDDQSYGEMVGQGCAWCFLNHTDIPLFFISFLILYLSINRCCYCVMVVAIISALLCMRFPLLNATLWSALIVLYMHKDWNLNFGNVKISWNRST
jgi:hypothetical protein